METPAFGPGRRRRFTSPENVRVSDSVFACPVTLGLSPHARQASSAAGPLRPCPVRVEPRRRAALPLAPGPQGAPGYLEQCRQLTEARAADPWLAAGSETVQQQALRDFTRQWPRTTPGNPPAPVLAQSRPRPGIPDRRAARTPGDVRKPDPRNTGEVRIPEGRVGAVPLVPAGAAGRGKSFRVTRDRAGRWHVAFAVVPEPVPAPGTGQVVGIDRGVAVSAALSTGKLLHAPRPYRAGAQERLRRLQRKLARALRGSNRRARVKHAIARLRARETDRRKDWAEKTSTGIARRFDVIRVEDLQIRNMTRSAKGTRAEPGPERPRQGRAEPGASCGRGGACWCAGWRRRPRAGWRRSVPRSRASGARRAGRWIRGSRESQARVPVHRLRFRLQR